MADIYDHINVGVTFPQTEDETPTSEEAEPVLVPVAENRPMTDNVAELNQYPNPVEAEKDVSFPKDKLRTTVDYFQIHDHSDEFNPASGLFSIYDPINPDRQLFDVVEQEAIELTSPPIKWYKLEKNRQDIDPLYGEAKRRDAYADPITIHGNYEDSAPSLVLSKFGINQPEELDIWFNYNYLLNKIDTRLFEGDILITYEGKIWEVTSSLVIDETLWRFQHNNVKVIRANIQGLFLPDVGAVERWPLSPDQVKR